MIYFDDSPSITGNKAKEKGIKIVYIYPEYTSQRCSKCGYIDANYRELRAVFKCQNCGFEADADYNASQNIGIKNIEDIIENTLKISSANEKQTKNT